MSRHFSVSVELGNPKHISVWFALFGWQVSFNVLAVKVDKEAR